MTVTVNQAPEGKQARPNRLPWKGPALLALGFAMLALAWSLPFNLASLTLPLLKRAGEGTPGLAENGQKWVQSEKTGPASLFLKAAKSIGDPDAAKLESSLVSLKQHNAGLVAWGG